MTRNAHDRRPVTPEDLVHLETDAAGELYWQGRRILRGGVTLGDVAQVATIGLVIVILLTNWQDVWGTLVTLLAELTALPFT